jgi:2-isopropylmalate synthase
MPPSNVTPKPMPFDKYRPLVPVRLADRTWPDQVIDQAPLWCSVDLRDGNQALIDPMDPSRKRRMFDALVQMGFKEIEVGFPAASQPDFDFIRQLIEDDLIPDDVTIQVLVQCRQELLERTYECLRGAPRAIVHFYNSTNPLQREVVFGPRQGRHRRHRRQRGATGPQARGDGPRDRGPLRVLPESFTLTEPQFAIDICEAVMDVIEPTPDKPIILNLPATVECYTANVYGDVIEWFGGRSATATRWSSASTRTTIADRRRGCRVRRDGRRGSRRGHAVRQRRAHRERRRHQPGDEPVRQRRRPELDISDIDALRRVAEYCNRLPVHPRTRTSATSSTRPSAAATRTPSRRGSRPCPPTTTSGACPTCRSTPSTSGARTRPSSASTASRARAASAYVMKTEHGFDMPRRMQIEFSKTIQHITEDSGTEISPVVMWEAFQDEYLPAAPRYSLLGHELHTREGKATVTAQVVVDGAHRTVTGEGSGPISAFVRGLRESFGVELDVVDYAEHAIGRGAEASAAAYVESVAATAGDGTGEARWGIGVDPDITTAGLKAVLSALERQQR